MTSSHQMLRDVFARLADIPDPEWDYVSRFVRESQFAAKAHLVRDGDVAGAVHFIVRGLVRNYQNDDGREIVHGFDYEGRWIGNYESLITGQPSHINIQALEETHTLTIPGQVLRSMYDRHPCWDRVGRKILEDASIRRQDKERRFRRYRAEEHYHILLARGAPFLDRVPLRHLASYLGVTPETLSRIRGRRRDAATQAGAEA